MEWFKHDIDASQDPKLEDVLDSDNGLAKIGAYWLAVELLYRTDDSLTVERFTKRLARLCGLNAATCGEYVSQFLEVGLFAIDNENNVFNARISAEKQGFTQKSKAAKKASNKRWNSKRKPQPNNVLNANADANAHPNADADAMQNAYPDKIREDKIREDIPIGISNSREQNTKSLAIVNRAAPKLADVEGYFQAVLMSTAEEAQKFHAHYEAQNWVTGAGNVITKWQAKALAWVTKSREDKSNAKTSRRGERVGFDADEFARNNEEIARLTSQRASTRAG